MGRKRRYRAISQQHELMQAVEALSKMMVPDIILPIQLRGEPEDRPEDQLMRCVMLSALYDFVDSYKPSRTPLQAERRRINREIAESWFAGEPGAPVEFELCCPLFGMSADEMRVQIGRLRERLETAARAANQVRHIAQESTAAIADTAHSECVADGDIGAVMGCERAAATDIQAARPALIEPSAGAMEWWAE